MNWYLVRMIFQIVWGDENRPARFDEQWRLIRADEICWAREKATIIGNLESQFEQPSGTARIEWKFIAVADIFEVPYGADGAQVFSTTEEPKDAHHYLSMITARSKQFVDWTEKQSNTAV